MFEVVLLAICIRIRILIATSAPSLHDGDTGIKSQVEGTGSRRCTGERGTRKEIHRACASNFPVSTIPPYVYMYKQKEKLHKLGRK